MTEEEIQQKRDEIEAELRSRYAEDPELFIRNLYIPSADGKQLFENCKADFQMDTFADLLPAIKAVRDGEKPQHQRFWIERTKKASKDADLAAAVIWLVAYARRPIYGQIAAADKDQAAIIKRRVEDLLFYNPWLTDLVEIQSYKIQSRSNQLAKIDIIAADVAGSHGETPDLLVVNELSHVTKWEFVENLLSNAAGVKRGVVVVATNAGFRGTKAWTWREIAIREWKTYIYARPAPWHSQAFVEDEQKRTTPSRFKRLWWGVWASGKGDALSEEDIDRVFAHGLKEITRPEPGYTYLVGLDLGVNHDHAAVVAVGVHEQKRLIRVASMRYWEPPTGGEIDLDGVKDHVAVLYRSFRFRAMFYDPYQAVLMAQQLRKTGVPCREMTFTPKNLDAMATALKQVIENGVIQSYDDGGRLRADFGKFNLVEKTYGLRLEAVSDETGHADVGTALVIVLPAAVEMLDFGSDRLQPDDELIYDGKDLTKEEIAELPPELKAIYEAYDDLDLRGLVASKRPKLSEMEYFEDD